jgi:DNA polymerase III delta subunit
VYRNPSPGPPPPQVAVFFGEDVYRAHLFLRELQERLGGPDHPPVERFDLQACSWREILEEARSPSLLFGSTRILLVESPSRKRDGVPTPHETLSEADKTRISDYLNDPAPGIWLVMIFPGKVRPGSPLIRFFEGFAPHVRVKELKALREQQLSAWVEQRVGARGKRIAGDATRRLVDQVGNDLRALDGEIEKVVTYIGGKTVVEAEDVEQVSAWIKSAVEWELSDHLEKADYRLCLSILQRLLDREGVAPLQILGLMAAFFQNILLAKLRLAEGKKDRKAVFKEIKPHIRESYRGLYERQFRQLFALAEGLSWADLHHLLDRLREVDLQLKTTNLAFQTLMEGFLFEYCRMRGRVRVDPGARAGGVTSRHRD